MKGSVQRSTYYNGLISPSSEVKSLWCSVGSAKGTASIPTDQTFTYANSVDPDEMAHNKLSHVNLHCMSLNK